MKPLSTYKIEEFLERFDNFKAAEFRSISILSASSMSAVFALQDKNRDFDWISLELEFHGISDATIPDEKALPLLDMSEGITLIAKEDTIGFCIGHYSNFSALKSSRCYLYCSSIKYQEKNF